MESPGYTEEFDYKSYQVINNKIDLIIKGISDDKDYAYIQVIAHIEKDPVNEYIAYNSRLFEKVANSSDNIDSIDDKLIAIISVISVLFIIIVTSLTIIVVRCNKKNKDLLNKVNATSFQSDNLASYVEEDENNPNLLIG